MELAYRLLTDDELREGLDALPGWECENGFLLRRFSFNTYMDGVEFAVSVAQVADAMDHHPDLEIGYRQVVVRTQTHSVGGLSPYDLELARQVNAISS